MNMLASFPKPFAIASFNLDLGTKSNSLRASSLHRHPYPLASKVIIKNLPYSTGETTLKKEFSNFGRIAEVKVVKDLNTKRSKGYAFIQYTSQDDAMLALETMDQKDFYGRTIYVEIAKLGRDDFGERPKTTGPPTIYVEIAKLGRDDFGERPKTTGPPKKWNLPQQEEAVDYWY